MSDRRAGVLGVVMLCGLLVACTESADPTTAGSVVTVTSVLSSSTVGLSSSTSSTLVTVPVVEGLLDWSVAAGPFPDGLWTFALSEDQLGFAQGGDSVDLLVSVAGGDPALVYDPGPGWLAQSLGFSDESLVAVVSSDAELTARVWQGGEVVRQYGPPPPKPRIPEMVIDADGTMYLTEGPEGEACLNRYDPADWSTFEEIVCTVDVSRIGLTAPGWVSYTSVARPGVDPCGPLILLETSTGETRRVAGEDCVFQGQATPDLAVWTRPPKPNPVAGANYDNVEVSGIAAGGPVTYLGRGEAGSVRICHDVAYWLFRTRRAGEQIKSWAGGDIHVVYRPPTNDYITSSVHCTTGGIAFLQAGDPIDGEQILVSPPVPWHVDPPA